ncbi:hypothetical protein Trco_007601 [Trichoderma cornu-damae]|uniref:N-acetyltransferase domain-containing protein n=1 Tax=Trichoderma cornu-damae TaxID=654480 RepID=A0A9P8QJI2_9HYPO|nr:hypothetical protein Trco_007601 [Trichoderma cornu-damae]
MSLPTAANKPSQTSIRSFFQAKTPKYAPPPSTSGNETDNDIAGRTDAISSDAPAVRLAPVPQSQSRASEPAPHPQSASPPSPSPSSSNNRNLPREASIRAVAAKDVNALRRLNSLLLPVSYPETFYSRAADPVAGRLSRVVAWAHHGEEPKPVGAIVCRVEPDVDVRAAGAQVAQNVYIQSLCLLSPYRSMGLISAALDDIVAAAATDPALDVKTVTAHVWTENDEGLRWYEARGFQKQGPAVKGYYLKLRPDSAWLVSKPVGVSLSRALPSSAPPLPRPDTSSTTAAAMSLLPMASQTPAASGAAPPATTTTTTTTTRPPARVASGQSYQNQRPETEWNDLPADMAPPLLGPPRNGSEPGSGASSRSSSTARRRRDRSYPAAAFGQ